MNDDLDGDEAIKNFEDLGRKLFQSPKQNVDEDEAEEPTEEESADE
jgi:hypothetical protein